jgi:hypothetical protein
MQDNRLNHSSWNQQSVYHEVFSYMHETGIAKQKARTTRLPSPVEMPLDITYVDRIKPV